MALIKGQLYWGYLDNENKIHVKLYTNDKAIEQMEKMPWCVGIFGPLEAYDLAHARQRCEERFATEIN